jgi:hypothetical protein
MRPLRLARRITVYGLALAVHASTLAFVTAGISIIAHDPGYTHTWLLGGLFTAIGVLLRPRAPRQAADAESLDRTRAPTLHALADRVADQAGVRRPVTVAVRDLWPGVAYQRIGLRRRPTLTIGLPLWLVLTPAQRVAALATACTRSSADDGLIVGGALSTLGEWRQALLGSAPLSSRDESHTKIQMMMGAYAPDTTYEAAGFVGRIFGRILGGPVLLVEFTLSRLADPDRRRTAARAAARAAEVARPEALARFGEIIAAPGRLLAPIQAAALRGEDTMSIRRAALARAAGDRAGGTATIGDERIDGELHDHYTRALRGFGLIT